MSDDEFIFLPLEVVRHDRLSLLQFRVLLGIYSYRDAVTNLLPWDTDYLCALLDVDDLTVCQTIEELIDLGCIDDEETVDGE